MFYVRKMKYARLLRAVIVVAFVCAVHRAICRERIAPIRAETQPCTQDKGGRGESAKWLGK